MYIINKCPVLYIKNTFFKKVRLKARSYMEIKSNASTDDIS